MKFEILHQPQICQREYVVVIDVLRAFTTAAYAFAKGVKEIIPVATVEDALNIKRENTNYLTIGEVDGKPVAGFDFGNSPTEIMSASLDEKVLIHRTTAGTQGIIKALGSDVILPASFVVCHATIRKILIDAPSLVTFIATGKNSGDEDLSLAEYMIALLSGENVSSESYLQRVENSPSGKKFRMQTKPWFPRADLEFSLAIDRFDFAMQIYRSNATAVIKKIPMISL